ncbi:MAG: oligoendopeptidase, partial [Solirubrobacterales bacterium]|nr:oligoendopeptidase [Solirubrobacterales bacterium]
MSAAADQLSDPELLETEWDLQPLVNGDGEPGVERLLAEVTELADAFPSRYAGKVAELDTPGLERAMRELGRIDELTGRAGSYASLQFATDTADPIRGAL